MNIQNVLKILKQKIEEVTPLPAKYAVSNGNQNGFEVLVCDKMQEITSEYPDIQFKAHMGHHFPDIDIIINKSIYGIELKSRNNGSWTTNGNSVFETISNDNYSEIYIFFGTQRNQRFEIKYKHYWEATEDIAVTHSPRFKINMNAETSVFESSETYNSFKSQSDEEKSEFLQTYLKEKSQGVKWFTSTTPQKVEPILFKNLSEELKKQIIAEMFVLFPNDLLHPSKKNDYTKCTKYLISTYYSYSSSMRDEFTGGGQVMLKGLKESLPQKYKTFLKHQKQIKKFCNSISDEHKKIVYNEWKKIDVEVTLQKENFFDDYLQILDVIGMYKSTDIKIDGSEMMLSELITEYKV